MLTKIKNNKNLIKKVLFTILIIWILMSVFLSIKVYVWHNVSYKYYKVINPDNPYIDIMSDESFARLNERDQANEVAKEKDVFIPFVVWYGVRAKGLCYVYYRSYYENGEIYNGTDGFYTIDLKFENFKWKVDYVEGMTP